MRFGIDAPPLVTPVTKPPIALNVPVAHHINIAIPSMTLGGAERIVHDTAVSLMRRNVSGSLFVFRDAEPSYPLTGNENFRVVHLNQTDKARRMRTIGMEVLASPSPVLFTHLVRHEDLVHLWRLGVSTVPVIHNLRPAWQDHPGVYDDPHVPFVVAVSEEVASALRRARCPRPVVVIRHELRHWATTEELDAARATIRRQYGIRPDTLLIGMVGMFKAQKAYTRAVSVLAELRKRCPAKLMILGGWDYGSGTGRLPYTAACAKAVRLGVMPYMITPGAVHSVSPYYAAFDVFLNTSVFEGLGLAILEALQTGCPVVSADARGNREIMPPEAVVVRDAADIGAYVDGIRRVIGKPRAVVRPPNELGLIPRTWCMLGRYAHEGPGTMPRKGTLFLTNNLNPGGVQRSLTNLLSRIASRHTVYLGILGEIGSVSFLDEMEKAGVLVFSLAAVRGNTDRAEKILELTSRFSIRNVCFWAFEAQVKLLIAKVLRQTKVRLVDVSPGPMLYEEMDRQVEFQRRICLTAPQYFASLHRFVVKYREGVPPARYRLPRSAIAVIPNGVSRVSARASRKEKRVVSPPGIDPRFAIGTCCRISPQKRIEFLIDMMQALNKTLPRASLTIVGGVETHHLEYWRSICAKLEEAGRPNVRFVGPQGDVTPFLRSFRAYVMISRHEGCPNAVLEAMAAGLPVVTNRVGGTGEQIRHRVNGLLVTGEDPVEAARAVAFLLQNPGTARAYGRAGRSMAREKFPMDRMADRYLSILGEEERIVPPRIRQRRVFGAERIELVRRARG